MKLPLSYALLLLPILFFGQSADYKIGDHIKESIEVYTPDNTISSINIPAGSYLLVYKYRWTDEGQGTDNKDSIRLLEAKIAELLVGGMVGNLKVICVSYNRGANYTAWMQKVKSEKPFKPSSKYTVDYYNLNTSLDEQKSKRLFSKLSLFGPDGRLLRWSSSIGAFYYHRNDNSITVKAKLLTDHGGVKEPVDQALVHVHAGVSNDTLAKAITDKYGDFEVSIPNSEKDYVIKAKPKKSTDNVLLVTQEGVVISKFDKKTVEFEYRLLKTDIIELSDLKVTDDIFLAFRKLKGAERNETVIVEDIHYGLLKYTIEKESLPTLNKVAAILKENPKLRLEVVSHTDSQGDDAFNLTLSDKRAHAVVDYLIQNGIEASRLTAKGKGETEIRNRCGNNVACSDKEHGYNRRTEFRFEK